MPFFICSKNELCFFVNYKCGYSYFVLLVKLGIVRQINKPPTSYKYIIITRNPYIRLESFYKDKLIQSIKSVGYLNQVCQTSLLKYIPIGKLTSFKVSFYEFLKCIDKGYRDPHIEPQYKIFPEKIYDIIHMEVDFIKHLQKYFSVSLPTTKVNSTEHVKMKIIWDTNMTNLVNKYYANDFVIGRYRMQ
jgi:hypothetical protein